MLFHGVYNIHNNHIIHRDLKTDNILITSNGMLKIADFGLSRVHNDNDSLLNNYSSQVASRWYRSPELLYGATNYDYAIDIWSIGCIMAEILNGGSAIFTGQYDIEQLGIIFQYLGTPNQDTWPNIINLPDYNKISFQSHQKLKPLHTLLPKDTPKLAMDLLDKCLQLDPKKRITISQALQHQFFYTFPLAL